METKIPSFNRLIESYKMCLMTEGKSPKTTSWYEANLRRFSNFLKSRDYRKYVPEIGLSEAREFIFHLQNGVRR